MRWPTPILFLLGSRVAIIDAVRNWKQSLILGALLVLSAGLARNYDGVDLLREPWRLLGPFAASIATSLMLFLIYKAICAGKNIPLPWKYYFPFLGLYWLTAPIAWLYAISYEMVVSPAEAITANAWTLLVVALWRVLLMARVAKVLAGCPFWRAAIIDLWFGATAIFLASFTMPAPILDLMGGLRLSPEEIARSNMVSMTQVFGFLAMCVLGIAGLIVLRGLKPRAISEQLAEFRPSSPAKPRFRWGLPILGAVCVIAWMPLVIWQQPLQRNRHVAERMVADGREADAVRFMSTLTPRDFPRNWRVPVRRARRGEEAAIEQMQVAVDVCDTAPWVRRGYAQQTAERLAAIRYSQRAGADWAEALLAADFSNFGRNDQTAKDRSHLRWILSQREALADPEIEAVTRALRESVPGESD